MAMYTNQIGLGNTVGIVGVIGESFGLATAGQQSWLLAGYSLSIGSFILVAGRLGDEFGHKRLFVIGMAWYALWSLIAGLAVYSTYILFIFARVFQGMGPAMTLPSALAILGNAYSPGPKKNMAFAWFGGTAPFGAISGFALGGLFALRGAWWPWTYWSEAIALACIAVFASWVIPNPPVSEAVLHQTHWEKLKLMDIPGCVTGVTSLVLINFAWNQAVVVGWQAPYVYVCLILGAAFGAVFFVIEAYWAPNPIIPFTAFNADIALVLACTACGWAVFGIWVRRTLPNLRCPKLTVKGLLPCPTCPQDPRHLSYSIGGMVQPRYSFWSHLCSGSRKIAGQDFRRMDNGRRAGSLYRWINPRCHHGSRFNLLDLLLFQRSHHLRGYGFLVSCRYCHLFGCCATQVPGYRC
jgi:MFS family permease